jgi:hypothetical protein
MFDWFKKRHENTPKPLTTADVPEILEQFGALMEKHPIAYMDESWLPVSKDQMRLVFKAACKMAPNAVLRNHIEVGWTFLSHFQPGIGQVPVEGNAPRDLSDESLARFDRYLELSKIAFAETEKEMEAMHEFIDNN